jgi:hypothetical protein
VLGVLDDEQEIAQPDHEYHGRKGVLAVSPPADLVALFLSDGCSHHVGRSADGSPHRQIERFGSPLVAIWGFAEPMMLRRMKPLVDSSNERRC